jgi:predicted DNA-binding transcriptional regulator AlpA
MEKQYEMMTLDEVVELTRMSEATIRRRRRDHDDPFPEPVELSPQLKVYPRAEVLAWIDRKMGQRRSA